MTPAHTAQPHHRWRIAGWSAAAALLLVPLAAMQVTGEVRWTALDFVTLAVMLAAAGGALEVLLRRRDGTAYRVAAALTVAGLFLLVWVNLAVGIIGSERNAANGLFAGVAAVAVGGSLLARLRASGMAWALLATAAAQIGVAAIALAVGAGADGPAWPRDVIGATALFTALWLIAAALFARSA